METRKRASSPPARTSKPGHDDLLSYDMTLRFSNVPLGTVPVQVLFAELAHRRSAFKKEAAAHGRRKLGTGNRVRWNRSTDELHPHRGRDKPPNGAAVSPHSRLKAASQILKRRAVSAVIGVQSALSARAKEAPWR